MAIKKLNPHLNFDGTAAPAITAPEHKDRIMHALLQLGGGIIMISDTTLDFDDPVEMGRAFEGLAAGGKVTMPLQDTFWGAKIGMLVDALGIPWMFNCEAKKA